MKVNSQKIKSLFLLSLLGSSLGKEEKSDNQTEISYPNSLPKLATNLTAEGNETEPILVYAGMPIFFNGSIAGDQGRCMSSFPVVPIGPSDDCDWDNGAFGFLTSARCCKNNPTCAADEVYQAEDNPQWIGQVQDTALSEFVGHTLIDFAFVAVNMDEETQLTPYVWGQDSESKLQLYPVTGLGSVAVGSEVCAYGAIAGYLCGNVVEMNLNVGWPERGTSFDGVNKVDLGDYGFYAEEDWGSPVYTISNIRDRTIVQALGYISGLDNSDQHHKFIYYTPLEKAFEMLASQQFSCNYGLMIYNETKAQEYQELLAQVEIPAKK